MGAGAGEGDGGVALAVLGLAGGAWLLLWAWSIDGHGHHGGAALPGSGALAVGAGWMVMVLAMMLPLAVGLLGAVRRLVRRRRRPGLYVAAAAAGFLAPWMLTGQAAQAGAAAARALADRAGLGAAGLGVASGLGIAAVGAVQLSPLKRRALVACRSPQGFAMRRWRGGRRPALDAARIGAAYGASCVGCCWALMCAMLAASAAGVLVMAPVAAVMAIERGTPWGPAVARGTGWALLALGAVWAAGAVIASQPGA